MIEPEAARRPEADARRRPRRPRRPRRAGSRRDNPQFARNLANRVWFHLLGRGIVDPVDDFRDSNPPVQPRAARRPDRRARRQRDAAPAAGRPDHEVADLPARCPSRTRRTPTTRPTSPAPSVRLLPAEVLLDAIGQAPRRARVVPPTPPAASARCSSPARGWAARSSRSFGKPDRLLTCECERSESTTLAQAFQLINGDAVRAQAGGRRQPARPACSTRGHRTSRSSTESTSPPSAASRREPSARPPPSHLPRAKTAARRGRTWPGRSLTARNSCCGIDRDRRYDPERAAPSTPGRKRMNHGCPDFRAPGRLSRRSLLTAGTAGIRRPEPPDACCGRRRRRP